ncbi:MAG: HDIG domain-containing protein [Ignavibacteriaceae bacterium]|nr:HDIG domain-containing protein [Ignavibacterium sp.]MCC6255693.1 HDIG domain-containing protein [Ignavibacteriaceae bacterium]HRN26716.1 HDIG domain-containing protein [Ignavibacteriaceae bacterium]HRP91314.1 HDIG domain-containing protein [Ignavibacteriaceae bacterium]HRQ54379.1 HDIG domain-containing protein [Ignavibacteriaceae bacterium]
MDKEQSILSQTGIKRKIIIGLITVILIVMMFPKGESIESEVTEGAIWTNDDLIAPFSFPIIKEKQTYENEVRDAEKSVFPVFDNITVRNSDSLKAFAAYIVSVIDENIKSQNDNYLNPTFLSSKSFTQFLNLRKLNKNSKSRKDDLLDKVFNSAGSITDAVGKRGIINLESSSKLRDSIAIRVGNIDKIEPTSKFYFFDQAKNEVRNKIQGLNYSDELKAAIAEFTIYFVYPNLVYNEEATNLEVEQAKDNVSKYAGIVNENERIIAKHDRITKQVKLKIESYKEAKGEAIGSEGIVLQLIGKFLHISFFITILAIYLYLFRKKIFYDNTKIVLISVIVIFVAFVTYLINHITIKAPIQYLIFVPAASMIFTIVFDSRVGLYLTVILSLIVGALRGNDYTFMAMNFIAGGLSVYTVRDIKNRSQIFRSFIFILIGYTASILAFGLERFAPAESMLIELAFAATNALISPVLTYGLLIFFERLFNITTDLTLLELSNFDRPLLRELARKAPGTFNHSMTMGTIAEAAAEKIGANALLARVGAYYHDIGKIIEPQGFVENQMNSQNLHENLPPEESVHLILKHVNDGIELARQHKLPQELIDFIPMHHGTTVSKFFYEKAKTLYGEDKINIDDFKYPGPKPNTKETAIVMLADGCESAVRSIADPDTKKVENMINNIFNSRLKEAQLDESPITFSDLSKMKEAFLSILISQHHRRIKYPKQEDAEKGISTDKDN